MMEFSCGLLYYWGRGGHVKVKVSDETRIYATREGYKFLLLSWASQVLTQYYLTDNENVAGEKKIVISIHDG